MKLSGRDRFRGFHKNHPNPGDGVAVSNSDFAAILASGISIDGSATFYQARAVVTQFHICMVGGSPQHVAGYLGLEFQINGQTHYGWAQVRIDARYARLSTTLVDFAYETIPRQAIEIGQTVGQFRRRKNYPRIDITRISLACDTRAIELRPRLVQSRNG